MLASTRGIVLKYIKYRETSIIVHVYTEHYGIQAYIVKGIRSPKNKRGMGYFQPLMLLDMVVHHKPQRDINYLSEWKMAFSLYSIYSDLIKSSICMFISELLFKSLKESELNEETFSFIFHSIQILEGLESGITNFHIQFMVKFAKYLGFGTEYYTSSTDEKIEILLKKLNNAAYGETLGLDNQSRAGVLNYMVDFFSIHISGFGKLKSKEVLNSIFST